MNIQEALDAGLIEELRQKMLKDGVWVETPLRYAPLDSLAVLGQMKKAGYLTDVVPDDFLPDSEADWIEDFLDFQERLRGHALEGKLAVFWPDAIPLNVPLGNGCCWVELWYRGDESLPSGGIITWSTPEKMRAEHERYHKIRAQRRKKK